jgi:hypothetical protein
MSMLIIDGVRYRLWTPKDEEKEFHPLVRKCSKDIFGEDSLYFNIKQILRSLSGIGSIPDAFVISLSRSEWYVVENELSSHPVYDHIVNQLTRFINGIKKQDTRSNIVDALYKETEKDPVLKATIEKEIRPKEIYHFLSKLLSEEPRIVIIIDEKSEKVEEAFRAFKYHADVIEFKTFVREDAPSVRAHIFEPLFTAGGVAKIEKREERKSKRWTYELLRERINDISKEILRRRVYYILQFAKDKGIFAVSVSQKPQFNLTMQKTGKIVLTVSFEGSLYAYFGFKEAKKYPTDEARQRLVEDLKRLNLLPQNINPDEIESAKNLQRRLDDLTDEEFTEFLNSLERNLLS